MSETLTFGLLVLCASAAGLLAVQSHAVSQRVRLPAPAFFLVAAAVASDVWPLLQQPSAPSSRS